MMNSLTIRRADRSDRLPVFKLASEFATSFDVQRDAFDDSFSQILRADDAQLLVAVFEDAVVGYCLAFDHRAFFANGRVTWVEEIAVTENVRHSGVGRKLMVEIEQWAKGRGSKMIGLATRRAGNFYLAVGYEESAVYFRKILASA